MEVEITTQPPASHDSDKKVVEPSSDKNQEANEKMEPEASQPLVVEAAKKAGEVESVKTEPEEENVDVKMEEEVSETPKEETKEETKETEDKTEEKAPEVPTEAPPGNWSSKIFLNESPINYSFNFSPTSRRTRS